MSDDLFYEEDFEDDDNIFTVEGRTLLIDGDTMLYKPCCIFNEDTDTDRRLTISNISKKLYELMAVSEAEDCIIFLSGKTNFRNHITDDYKANRKDVERPINLAYIKRYLVDYLGAVAAPYLEADDLLHIYSTDDTVIWSLDKDLRQISGLFIDEETQQIGDVPELGELYKEGKKVHFSGYKGLMYQALVGDSADYIIGCGIRKPHIYKSGSKKGQEYIKRVGTGSLGAIKLLSNATTKGEMLSVVVRQYKEVFGKDYRTKLEQQMRLLVMVDDYNKDSEVAKMWTLDGRDEYMNVRTGEFL